MENPHEKVQVGILARIVGNVERLNQSVATLNQELERINTRNRNLELMGQMCEHYGRATAFNLKTTGNRQGPV
uniref:DASH complex subunit DAD4 n=2 Tax=Eremothecium gossypii (strain ATCC 10895 / CBS 109.51 / FGSC 9923 / NRRL Y-1056) TaxID=284811 RepID=DAD4_EREGS|nr:RecName: Full=DASH complex subunit DAD4; AltName: Full=Outer kinetochore protein DAD4 [Eremothecium gossypii ATCC 10895]